MKIAGVIASGLGVGLSPFAPGTLGSLWGVALAFLTWEWPPAAKIGLLVAVSLVGWWASEQAGRMWGHDHPRIVIDEVAGQDTLDAVASANDAGEATVVAGGVHRADQALVDDGRGAPGLRHQQVTQRPQARLPRVREPARSAPDQGKPHGMADAL